MNEKKNFSQGVPVNPDAPASSSAASAGVPQAPENSVPVVREYRRPSWDEYFIELVRTVGMRGTCDRGRSGCVIVKDKRVLTTGYVGSPAGMAHCDDAGHLMKSVTHEDGHVSQHCMRTAHAEANAISQAARFGIALDGSTIYCKMVPCDACSKLLVNAGIKRVVAEKRYHQGAETMLRQAGVRVDIIHDEVEAYKNQ